VESNTCLGGGVTGTDQRHQPDESMNSRAWHSLELRRTNRPST
jgi:hypothetical protein